MFVPAGVHLCGVLLLLEWPVARPVTIEQEEQVKSREEIIEILEAFDLTGSFRDAGELAGCSHHTVAGYVAKRDAGELPDDGPQRRERIIDPFLPKIEEWVERSARKIRADVAFDKLTALGYTGSERTVRRAVAEAKANHRRGRRRVYRPCGRSGTGAPAPWLLGERRCCSVRGWRGAGSG